MEPKLDETCQLWLTALINGFGGLRVSFTDENGTEWAGVAWKNMRWNQEKTLEKNEPDKTDAIE